MKQISLTLPETLDLSEAELKLFIAAKLYEQGKLSLGEAALLANVSKKTFIEMIGLYSVSVFNQSVSELESDLGNAL